MKYITVEEAVKRITDTAYVNNIHAAQCCVFLCTDYGRATINGDNLFILVFNGYIDGNNSYAWRYASHMCQNPPGTAVSGSCMYHSGSQHKLLESFLANVLSDKHHKHELYIVSGLYETACFIKDYHSRNSLHNYERITDDKTTTLPCGYRLCKCCGGAK